MNIVLAVATQKGVYILRPGQESSDYATHAHGLAPQDVFGICVDPRGGLYACAVNGLVYHSPDGAEWKPLLDGLEKPGMYSVAVHPEAPDVVFAGGSPAYVVRRVGAGKWERLRSFNQVPGVDKWTHPLPPYLPRPLTMVFHPEEPQLLFVGVKTGGVVATDDGGETWKERQTGLSRDVNQLLIHPLDNMALLAATDAGFFRSSSLGKEWVGSTKGMPYTCMRSLAFDPENPLRLIAGVNKTPEGTGASLFRSSDGGQSWQITANGLPPLPLAAITTVASAPGRFVAGTDKGDIFGTDNFGEKWERLDANLPPIHAIVALA